MKRNVAAIVVLSLLIGTSCDWKSGLLRPTGTKLKELYPELHLSGCWARCLMYNGDTDDLMWYVESPIPHPDMLQALLASCRESSLSISEQSDAGFIATKNGWKFQVRTLPSDCRYLIYRIDAAEEDFELQTEFERHVKRLTKTTG